MFLKQTLRPVFFGFLICVCARMCGAQQSSSANAVDARELYTQLNNVGIDPGEIHALRGARLTRDRVKIYFNRGYVGFFDKVAGEITGAFFVGDGEVLMIPPNAIEKGSLKQLTGAAVLEERFSFAYLRFTDNTAAELKAAALPVDPEDPDQPTDMAQQWNPIIHRLNSAFSLRIMEDLLGERDFPYFIAQVHGLNVGPFGVVIDQRSPEAVTVGAARTVKGTLFRDIWCSFPTRAADLSGRSAEFSPVKVESYKIDTRIQPDNSLQAVATVKVQSLSSAERVLPFLLSSRLDISEVHD